MVDQTDSGGVAAAGQPPVNVRVLAQYIKDLSFENPDITRLMNGPPENPNLKLEVNVNARQMQPQLFESSIDLKATATSQTATIYELELVYAGLFKIENLPEQAYEPFLLINCPMLVFPFVRRLVADVTREGGFPPLLLDPIDFGGLYMRRRQQMAGQGGQPGQLAS